MDLDEARSYAAAYYKDTSVLADFELLTEYVPDVFTSYIGLRQAAFENERNDGLSRREKELIILAIEMARLKSNPPPTGHARRAIEAGASVSDIAEVASLCIMIGGMLTYQESGRYALRAAQEYERARAEAPAQQHASADSEPVPRSPMDAASGHA